MTDDSDLIWQQKLEELRRSSQISIDRQGRWWHEKVSFEHPRILAALNAGLSWTMTDESSEVTEPQHCFDSWMGDATVQLGSQWCYVECDLTPFLVMSLRIDPQVKSIVALLNNHERWPLRLITLHDDVLFTRLAYDRPSPAEEPASVSQHHVSSQVTHGEASHDALLAILSLHRVSKSLTDV